MSDKKITNVYDDDDIPQVDLPKPNSKPSDKNNVEPLPESSRSRKDGPGGE